MDWAKGQRQQPPAEMQTPTPTVCASPPATKLRSYQGWDCLDCGGPLPAGHAYRCQACMLAAWREIYGYVPALLDDASSDVPAIGSATWALRDRGESDDKS